MRLTLEPGKSSTSLQEPMQETVCHKEGSIDLENYFCLACIGSRLDLRQMTSQT
jgi:hypothetical protein